MSGAVRWAIAACILPMALPAQDPALRSAVAAFRDSVRADTSGQSLAVLDRSERHQAARSDVAALRLGFVELREGELAQSADEFQGAFHTFDGVVRRHAGWPVALTGRALARLNVLASESGIDRKVTALLRGDPGATAEADLAAAAAAGDHGAALLAATTIALDGRRPVQLDVALGALRRAAALPIAREPLLLLARLRLERITGNPDSAMATARALLQVAPDDPLALLDAAHAALSIGDLGGADWWFRGLGLADAASWPWYRADLILLLPDSVLTSLDNTSGAGRVAVARRFFAFDEFGQPRSAAERLRVHYMRLDEARQQFSLPTPTYAADPGPMRPPTGREMDERGLVWVLHGRPDEHTYLKLVGMPPNESWRYRGDDGGELLFHFVKTDARGFRRVPSLFDVLALSKPLQATGHGDVKAMAARGEAVPTYGATWTAQTVQEVLYSRENMSPTYARILSAGKNGALALQDSERVAGDSSMARGETDGNGYELPLDARVDAVAVGSTLAGPLLQVAFAIPGSSLYATPGETPVVYPVRMRVSVLRLGSGEVVATVDTLRRFVAAEPLDQAQVLFGRLAMAVPAGDYSVRIALETPGRGMHTPRESIHVAAPGDTALDLSDLALGTRNVRLPWRSERGDTVWIDPLHEFAAHESMQLYVEAIGLRPGTAYRVDLGVYRNDEAKPQVRLRSNAVAHGSPEPIRREIDLRKLKPGAYQLEVTVTSAAGSVVRRRPFTVIHEP